MAKTRKMTKAYWKTLGDGTKRRALMCCFPIHPAIVDMLFDMQPNLQDPWWPMVFSKVRIPEKGCPYKFAVNHTYYM